MHILFVDESGTPPPPHKAKQTPCFVLGGVIIPEDVWPKLANDMRHLNKANRITGEIKWRFFAPPRGTSKPHSLSHLDATQKEAYRTALYAAICRYKSIKVICVVTDVVAAYAKAYIKTADDLYHYSYKLLTERFQYYLQDLEKTVGQRIHGIIVCDHRGPQDDDRLRDLHHRLINGGQANTSRYNHLIEGLFIAPSHLSVGIQLADMVAGAVYRSSYAGDQRFIIQVDPAIRRGPNGKTEGFGLVRFPK